VTAVLVADRLGAPAAFHGAAPAWDPVAGHVLWVDAPAGRLLRSGLDGATEAVVGPDAWLTAVVPRRDGHPVVVGARQVWEVDPAAGPVGEPVALPLAPGERAAVAAVGAHGLLHVATSRRAGVAPGGSSEAQDGRVLAVAPDGRAVVVLAEVLAAGVATLPGGLVAVADSGRGRLERYEAVGGRWRHQATLAAWPSSEGRVAGLCGDAEAAAWVALWGAGRVLRVDGDRRVTHEVRLPVRRPTGCALAGEDRRTLVVTTSGHGCLPGEEPEAGALFAVGVEVPGVEDGAR